MKRDEGEAKMSAMMQKSLDEVEQTGVAGLMVVPSKPTLEMLTRGAAAGGVPVEAIWRIWQAMLAACDEDEA